MTFDPELSVPWGYSTGSKRLADADAVLRVHYHPEYIRRLLAWLTSKGGLVGVGGTWRPQGSQPTLPGFAPEGKSFHQDQAYVDGFVGACAVDLVARNPGHVHRAPVWSEVPAQDSTEAKRWGVHCNIVPSEPWHMQPVEIDGWQTWWNAGRPAPVVGYPIPGDEPEPPPPPPPPSEDDVIAYNEIRDLWIAPGASDVADGGGSDRWLNAVIVKCGSIAYVQRQNNLTVTGRYDAATAAAYAKQLAAMKTAAGA